MLFEWLAARTPDLGGKLGTQSFAKHVVGLRADRYLPATVPANTFSAPYSKIYPIVMN